MIVYFDSGDNFRAILSSRQQTSEILDCLNKVLVHVETLVASPHTYLCHQERYSVLVRVSVTINQTFSLAIMYKIE